MKRLLPLGCLLLTGSSMPDMGKVGEAAHGLTDTQSALYFMAVLLVALLVERGVTGWRSAATFSRLAKAIDKLSEDIRNGSANDMAQHMLVQYEMSEAKAERATIRALLESKR